VVPLGATGCEALSEAERDACEDPASVGAVTGVVTQGKDPKAGASLTFPYKVGVRVESDVLVRSVYVGSVLAKLTDATRFEWEAQLYEQDLEQARVGDEAKLKVVATDLCGTSYPIDEVVLPLGPAPGVLVSDLVLSAVLSPSWECSVPQDQSAPALVRVAASKASAGAKVTVEASQGKFVGGAAKLELSLVAAGDHAEATTYFVPEKQGSVVLSAYAKGATAEPVVLPVVAAPEMVAPTTTLKRGEPHVVTVRSRGNLASCLTEEVIAGAAEVTIVDPPLGPLVGVMSVKRDPVSCDEVEALRVQVTFASTAPEGAAVTLRCWDSFSQEANVTLKAASGS